MANQWSTILDRLRVLIIEDHPDAIHGLERVTHWILDLGCDVDVCRTDPEAIERVGEFKPHVVLLDVGLLTSEGFDVVRGIRHIADVKQPLIVAVTIKEGADSRQNCEWAGIDLEIRKPISLNDLVNVLTEAGWSPGPRATT